MPAGTPLVLLHPFPTDSGFWAPMRPHLASGRPVLAPDAPGFGAAPPRASWSIAEAADDVARLIRAEAGGRAAVCGLSMGGYTALALADRHPDTVEALVLADTRAEADDEAGRAARRDAIAAVTADRDAYLDGFLPRLLRGAPDPEHLAALAMLARRQPAASIAAALSALAGRPDRRAGLADITAPVLVIVGEEDGVTPRSAAETIRDGIPGAALEVIPAAGHMTALEAPGPFAALVEGLLRTLPRG